MEGEGGKGEEERGGREERGGDNLARGKEDQWDVVKLLPGNRIEFKVPSFHLPLSHLFPISVLG